MRPIISLLMLLLVAACVPSPQSLDLREICSQELSAATVAEQHWLNQADTWRLRQSALLELRGRKFAFEGFMMLDLSEQQLHMVAMNEMGVVFFELIVTPDDQELRRVLPQLQQQRGLAEGIAASLRRIYLKPQPQTTDLAQMQPTRLSLSRPVVDGNLSFVFDCDGRLRAARSRSDTQDWQVIYENYQGITDRPVPEKIVMNNFQQAVTLTVWQREITLEP
ncbi:MAG TPA: DUF3261 domain-containing protein [Pelovirga sp.]|nr:DUF3261 domain-containing protein [Pelovirga sp.]